MASRLSNYDSTLGGQLLLGGEDAWLEYRAILFEERAGGTRNYSALLAPSATKAHKAVSYREEDGERLPDTLSVQLEPRELTRHFALFAEDAKSFVATHKRLMGKLREGENGYTVLYIPELERRWRLVYLSGGDHSIVGLDSDQLVLGRFSIKFREPKPTQ